MAKSPNTTPISSMFAEWTQPYVSMNEFYIPKEQSGRTTAKERSISVSNELARLDFLEDEIQSMLTYPDAESILNKITKEIEDD